jgi:Protein ENHANCED DISEASE RESISTANCE 2, C-terminal
MMESPAPCDNVIRPLRRFAGPVHVRGKIRRIWRLRYLELCDDGLLRYYDELPADHVVDLDTFQGNNMILSSVGGSTGMYSTASVESDSSPPKYTLHISNARILDATTLRDMHVGLPRGTYGFVFRGERISVDTTPEEHGVSSMLSSAIMRGLQSSPTMERILGGDLYHSYYSMPNSNNISVPRDYYGAVNTLEEAQMWVVALQWAATQAKPTRISVSGAEPTVHLVPEESWLRLDTQPRRQLAAVDTHDDDDASDSSHVLLDHPERRRSSMDTTMPKAADHRSTSEPVRYGGSSRSHQVARNLLESSPPALPGRSTGGKIVVTKITSYRPVRLPNGHSFDIAYEIHGLLIHKSRQVDLWILDRTANDFEQLVLQLCHELGPTLLDRAQIGLIRQLPRINKGRSIPPSALERSVSIADGILRTLVMDAAIVNAASMKVFLGIHPVGTSQNHSPWSCTGGPRWHMSESVTARESLWQCANRLLFGLHDATKIRAHETRALLPHVTIDQYVRNWMFRRSGVPSQQQKMAPSPTADIRRSATASSSPSIPLFHVITSQVVQRPILSMGAIGMSTAALVPLTCLWNRWVPSLTIRVDFLVVSWIGAAYLGRWEASDGYDDEMEAENRFSVVRHEDRSKSSASEPTSPARENLNSGVSMATDANLQVGHIPSNNVLVSCDNEQGSHNSAGNDTTFDAACASPDDAESDGEEADTAPEQGIRTKSLSSPIPQYPANGGVSCWSQPQSSIFYVRGPTYLQDKVKIPSEPCPLTCRGVDVWLSDNPLRHIARHPSLLGGKLGDEDTLLVNFLLPFGNLVAYFSVPPLENFPPRVQGVWTRFLKGDQQYRDKRLKLLPLVINGPWIVKAAVGPGTAPALLGKVIPLQYYFQDPEQDTKGSYEIDVIITASTIAKGILSVVKGHTKHLSIAFAFIIEASETEELPETVLCSFQLHALELERCPPLPDYDLDGAVSS